MPCALRSLETNRDLHDRHPIKLRVLEMLIVLANSAHHELDIVTTKKVIIIGSFATTNEDVDAIDGGWEASGGHAGQQKSLADSRSATRGELANGLILLALSLS